MLAVIGGTRRGFFCGVLFMGVNINVDSEGLDSGGVADTFFIPEGLKYCNKAVKGGGGVIVRSGVFSSEVVWVT